MKGGRGARDRARRKQTLINKLWILHVSIIQPLSFCFFSPKSNSWWHKKRKEFVLMFVQSWGNKLDRDLANQNSLQKLSDPGGSRALDKQDWLFQRHAYITPIWARAITHRQLREYKPDSYWKCSTEDKKNKNMARLDQWISVYKWRTVHWATFLPKNARALIRDRHDV